MYTIMLLYSIIILQWPLGIYRLIAHLRNFSHFIVSPRKSLDMLSFPLPILLLAVIGAKLAGPQGGLKVDKLSVTKVVLT